MIVRQVEMLSSTGYAIVVDNAGKLYQVGSFHKSREAAVKARAMRILYNPQKPNEHPIGEMTTKYETRYLILTPLSKKYAALIKRRLTKKGKEADARARLKLS